MLARRSTFFKLLFPRFDCIQHNLGLRLAEPKLISAQIIFLQATQLSAKNGLSNTSSTAKQRTLQSLTAP
jgi:hypothetical protein